MGISDACRPDKMDSCCPSGPGYYRPAALTNESSVLFGQTQSSDCILASSFHPRSLYFCSPGTLSFIAGIGFSSRHSSMTTHPLGISRGSVLSGSGDRQPQLTDMLGKPVTVSLPYLWNNERRRRAIHFFA
jgi:hypothetical protein